MEAVILVLLGHQWPSSTILRMSAVRGSSHAGAAGPPERHTQRGVCGTMIPYPHVAYQVAIGWGQLRQLTRYTVGCIGQAPCQLGNGSRINTDIAEFGACYVGSETNEKQRVGACGIMSEWVWRCLREELFAPLSCTNEGFLHVRPLRRTVAHVGHVEEKRLVELTDFLGTQRDNAHIDVYVRVDVPGRGEAVREVPDAEEPPRTEIV